MNAKPLKTPVSVLILTRNEEANIAACLKSVDWVSEVFVVDSFSTDGTVELAERLGARVYQHGFETCATQWNWALDNIPFANEWVLVLDADERIPQSLAEEISEVVNGRGQDWAGYYLRRRFFFFGKWLKHGGLYPTWILRLFRRRAGRFGRHGISEHLMLEGKAGYLQAAFDHCNNRPLSDWVQKHNQYAGLEAEQYVRERFGATEVRSIQGRFWGSQAERKQWIKLEVWNRLPLLLRPFLFFSRNYFLKLGFLDGKAGFIYHVLWSFWYPLLVSARILEKQHTARQAGLRVTAPKAVPFTAAGSPARKLHN